MGLSKMGVINTKADIIQDPDEQGQIFALQALDAFSILFTTKELRDFIGKIS